MILPAKLLSPVLQKQATQLSLMWLAMKVYNILHDDCVQRTSLDASLNHTTTKFHCIMASSASPCSFSAQSSMTRYSTYITYTGPVYRSILFHIMQYTTVQHMTDAQGLTGSLHFRKHIFVISCTVLHRPLLSTV